MYIGVNNVARQIKSAYIGVNGVARKVKAVYVGVNGVARLVWQAIKKKVSSISSTKQVGIATDSLSLKNVQAIHKIDDNHYLVGVYANYTSDTDRCFLYNCYLNNDGSVSSFTRFETNYEHTSSWQTAINSIGQFNNTYGACISTNYYNAGSGSDFRTIHVFDLSNSSSQIASTQVASGTLDYNMPLVNLNNDSVLYPCYSSDGYVYGRIYKYSNGTLSLKYYNCLSTNIPNYYSPSYYSNPIAFALSNNRFGVMFTIKEAPSTMKQMLCIFNYSYDSSDNLTVTRVTYHLLPWVQVSAVTALDDDYFVCSGYYNAFGLHIDSSNNYSVTSILSTGGVNTSRIGQSDSVYGTFGSNAYIYYYDKTANTLTNTYSGSGDSAYFYAPYKDQAIMYCTVPSSTQLAFNSISFD